LSPPRLYLLSPPEGPFLDDLGEILASGVDWFQYRRRRISDLRAREEIERVLRIAHPHDVSVIVNDRPDLALASGAMGVHLGVEDLPPASVKTRWPGLTVGATQRAERPLVDGADYYGVGPVFETDSKRLDVDPCGWAGVRGVLERTRRPVFAIGGVQPARLAGAPTDLFGVAVLSAVWGASDPPAAAAALKRALRSRGGRP